MPATPQRSIRVSDEQWGRWSAHAEAHDLDITTLIEESVEARINGRGAASDAKRRLTECRRALKEIKAITGGALDKMKG